MPTCKPGRPGKNNDNVNGTGTEIGIGIGIGTGTATVTATATVTMTETGTGVIKMRWTLIWSMIMTYGLPGTVIRERLNHGVCNTADMALYPSKLLILRILAIPPRFPSLQRRDITLQDTTRRDQDQRANPDCTTPETRRRRKCPSVVAEHQDMFSPVIPQDQDRLKSRLTRPAMAEIPGGISSPPILRAAAILPLLTLVVEGEHEDRLLSRWTKARTTLGWRCFLHFWI